MSEDLYSIFNKKEEGNYKRSRFEIGNARVSFQSFMATIVITTTYLRLKPLI